MYRLYSSAIDSGELIDQMVEPVERAIIAALTSTWSSEPESPEKLYEYSPVAKCEVASV